MDKEKLKKVQATMMMAAQEMKKMGKTEVDEADIAPLMTGCEMAFAVDEAAIATVKHFGLDEREFKRVFEQRIESAKKEFQEGVHELIGGMPDEDADDLTKMFKS